MSDRGVLLLGELVGRIDRLEVRCSRCDRYGRLRLARLIAEHGADLDLGRLRCWLAGDCPGAAAAHWHERCDVYLPQLSALVRQDAVIGGH
jgi:hypothetical protein